MPGQHNKGKQWGKPFVKGQSGNPTGRPKAYYSATELARCACSEAIKTLISIMRDKKASRNERANACDKLLDRGIGKPLQTASIAVGTLRDMAQLTDEELMAIASGQTLETVQSDIPLLSQTETVPSEPSDIS
jgi:hypothetical protein